MKTLGLHIDTAIDQALKQVLTPKQYLERLQQMGVYPELDSAPWRFAMEQELRFWAGLHSFNRWIIVHTNGYEELFEGTPDQLFVLLERHPENDIQTIISEQETIGMMEQEA